MDKLDSAIIRHLCYGTEAFRWDVRASYAQIAKVLDVDEDTVRGRVRQLEASGFVTGWTTSVHPGLLGRSAYNIEAAETDEADKKEAIRALALLDGVYMIFDHHRAGLFLGIFHEPGPPLERFTDLVASVCGAPAEVWPASLPPVTVVPDVADWRLIQAMRHAPRRPLAELAAATGTSVRTVQRRLGRLMDGCAVFPVFRSDFDVMKGLLPVHVRVVYADEGPREPVASTLLAADNLIYSNIAGPMATMSCMLESIASMESLRERLEALPGAERVRVDIQRGRVLVSGWMDDAIAKHANGSDRSR